MLSFNVFFISKTYAADPKIVGKLNSAFESIEEWLLKLVKLENPANLYQSGKITSARLELARYYRDGIYFPKDVYQSYLWYIIFNESKGDMSIMIQQEAMDELKKIENELTENQIESRELAAEKLLGRKLKNIKNLYQINH